MALTEKDVNGKERDPIAENGFLEDRQQSSPGPSTSTADVIPFEKAAFEALTCYEKAALERHMYAEAYCNMGVIYKNRGGLESAIACYERCLAVSPNFEIAKNNMAIALTDFGTKGISLCSDDHHPDTVIQEERCLKVEKKAYYSELKDYNKDMIVYLQIPKENWESCKDPEKEIVQKLWRFIFAPCFNFLESDWF